MAGDRGTVPQPPTVPRLNHGTVLLRGLRPQGVRHFLKGFVSSGRWPGGGFTFAVSDVFAQDERQGTIDAHQLCAGIPEMRTNMSVPFQASRCPAWLAGFRFGARLSEYGDPRRGHPHF